MSDPKKKSKLKKQVRRVEDEFGLDSGTEDLIDGIIDLFNSDDDDDDTDSSDDDDSDDDFGDGDFGGGGSSDDW